VGVFVTPCLGTNLKATAAKKAPPFGAPFHSRAWELGWGRGELWSQRHTVARGVAGARGGAVGVPVALGSPLARDDVPWVPMGPDPNPPIWLQIRGWLKRPLRGLIMPYY
jgi:hypothetical protein